MEKEKIIIRWITQDKKAIDAIRKRFQIPKHTTLNGLSPVEIPEEDKSIFEETVRRGFMSIIDGKWCKKGEEYIFYFR